MTTPQVSFYIINDASTRDASHLACQLCVKAAQQGNVCVRLSADQLDTFDALLWSFEQTSFLPHDVQQPTSPINLTTDITAGFAGIVINLSDSPMDMTHVFANAQPTRMIEIIAPDEASKVAGRKRYQAYKASGCTPETFHV